MTRQIQNRVLLVLARRDVVQVPVQAHDAQVVRRDVDRSNLLERPPAERIPKDSAERSVKLFRSLLAEPLLTLRTPALDVATNREPHERAVCDCWGGLPGRLGFGAGATMRTAKLRNTLRNANAKRLEREEGAAHEASPNQNQIFSQTGFARRSVKTGGQVVNWKPS
jgi:hypothetical protein